MITEGTKTNMPRDPMSSKPARQMAGPDQAIPSDDEGLEMDSGNGDVDGGELGQNTGMRPPRSGKEHPHGAQ
jgi:hypothetical protein